MSSPLSSSPLETFENQLPELPKPLGNYIPVIRVGNLVSTSGTLPMKDGTVMYTGPVGTPEVTAEMGGRAARLCAENCLNLIRSEIGSLSRIKRIVKLTGYVNSVPDFYGQPAVLNGASDFLVQLFGDAGKHTRAAVGVAALPLNASVEIEMTVEIIRDVSDNV